MRCPDKPEGWTVHIRRTSGTVYLWGGVPREIFIVNVFLSLALVGICLGTPDSRFTRLAPLGLVQLFVLHGIFRKLTERDPWWFYIFRDEVWVEVRRFLRTRRRRTNLLES